MKNHIFAQRLREARKRAGLTQPELAHLTEVHETTIRRWESGRENGLPDVTHVKKLCEVLHVSEAELLNEPTGEQIKLTLSWNWEEMKEGDISMTDNKFQIVLGDDGHIGLTGASMFKNREAIDDFVARVREQLEIAFDAQVKRGVIQIG